MDRIAAVACPGEDRWTVTSPVALIPRMACCAFALFVLSQLLAPFVGPWRRLFGEGMAHANTTVAWSPGSRPDGPTVSTRAPGAMRWRRGLFVAVGLELVVALAAFDFFAIDTPSTAAADGSEWLARDWCRGAESIFAGEE